MEIYFCHFAPGKRIRIYLNRESGSCRKGGHAELKEKSGALHLIPGNGVCRDKISFG